MQNEGKERTIDDIRKDLELACIDNDQLLANQVNLDLQIKVRTKPRELPLWFQFPPPPLSPSIALSLNRLLLQ